jgi:hypothetical protein
MTCFMKQTGKVAAANKKGQVRLCSMNVNTDRGILTSISFGTYGRMSVVWMPSGVGYHFMRYKATKKISLQAQKKNSVVWKHKTQWIRNVFSMLHYGGSSHAVDIKTHRVIVVRPQYARLLLGD